MKHIGKHLGTGLFSMVFGLSFIGSVQAAPEQTPQQDLAAVLAMQSEEARARYPYRNPQATLEFLGIMPGMTVVEALPGRGWYSRILIPYLGPEGRLIGADYAYDMLPKFGFYSDEQLAERKTWASDWPVDAAAWYGEEGAAVAGFTLGAMPAELQGQADVVLFIRALHNLNRFEDDGGYLTAALADAYAVLKPGGILGVVQHEARTDMPDDWASGANGYLKKSLVIDRLTAAGFEFVGESEINQNPADQPTVEDMVWRLPPTYFTSRDDEALRTEYEAIGESNRMTLKFRKPE